MRSELRCCRTCLGIGTLPVVMIARKASTLPEGKGLQVSQTFFDFKNFKTLEKLKKTTEMLKPDEICKVRRGAVSRGKGLYLYAVFKHMNKTSAKVTLVEESNFTKRWIQTTSHTVPLNTLWKLKAAIRRPIEKKLAKHTAVANSLLQSLETPTYIPQTMYGLNCISETKITGCGTTFTVVHGGVTDFTGDAIVNAANTRCLGGGGIDGLIGQLGRRQLYSARMALPIINSIGDRCETGDAKITTAGGDLKCSFVIHAVGPVFSFFPNDYNKEYELLANAYKNALLRARERNLKSVAFCILSAGIFRGDAPLDKIIETAIRSIVTHSYFGLERVFFCAYAPHERVVTNEVVKLCAA